MKNYFKTLRKRGLALVLVLMMCMSVLQSTAFAFEPSGAETDVTGGSGDYLPFLPPTGPSTSAEFSGTDESVSSVDTVNSVSATGTDESVNSVEPAAVPAEVQAFLDAVAELPNVSDITADNAAGIMELLYGETLSDGFAMVDNSEAPWTAQEDVQAAYAKYVEVFEKVTAVMAAGPVDETPDMGSALFENFNGGSTIQKNGITISPTAHPSDWTYGQIGSDGNLTNYGGKITKMVGESGFYRRCPTNTLLGQNCGHVVAEYTSDYYTDITATSSEDDIICDWGYDVGYWNSAYGYCLQANFKANKPGKTTVAMQYYVNFMVQYESGYCNCGRYTTIPRDYTWHKYKDTIDVTVNARYQLNYDTKGGSAVDPTYRDEAATTTTLNVTSEVPKKDNYEFKGWSLTDPATLNEGETPVTVTSVDFDWERDGEGTNPGSKGNPVSKTLYAVWAPDAPKREDLYGILGGFVKVQCVSEGDGLPHDEKTYSTNSYYSVSGKYESEVGEVYKDGDTWKVDVTLNGDVYAGLYGFEPSYGTGVTHTLAKDEDATKTVTLTWNGEKWESGQAKNTILATFRVVCKDDPIPTTYTVTYTDGVDGEEVVFADQSTDNLAVGDDTPAFKSADKGTEEVKDADGNVTGYQPVREGYVFTGWKLTSVDPNKDGVQPTVAAEDANTDNEIIYAAQWEIPYTVEWYVVGEDEPFKTDNTRSGELSATVSVTEADKVVTGYTFDADNEDNVLADTLAEGETTVLKLYFTKNPNPTYTLTYHENAGEDTVANMPDPNPDSAEVTEDSDSHDFNVSTTVPTRTGYTFTGWNTAANGTGTSYTISTAEDGTVSATPATITATKDNKDLHLYAQWEEGKLLVNKDAQLVLVRERPTDENPVGKVTACFVDYTVTLTSNNLEDQYFIELQDVMQKGLSFVKNGNELAGLTFTLTKEDGSTYNLNNSDIAYFSGVSEDGTAEVYGKTVDERLLLNGAINNTLATMLFQLTDKAADGLYFQTGDTITVTYRASMDANVFSEYATEEELLKGVKDLYNHVYAATWDAKRLAQ